MRARILLVLLLGSTIGIAHANDFPTRARVEFVLKCMRESDALPEWFADRLRDAKDDDR